MWQTMTPTHTEPSQFLLDAFKIHFDGITKFKQRVRICGLDFRASEPRQRGQGRKQGQIPSAFFSFLSCPLQYPLSSTFSDHFIIYVCLFDEL